MRSSGLTTLVCLAAVVVASPTPSRGSLDARDVWSSPDRRDVFHKRAPGQEIVERNIDQRSSLVSEFSARAPSDSYLDKRETWTMKRREALEDIVARERELEFVKREYEEMQLRDLGEFGSMHFSKREPQFGNFNLASILSAFGNGTASGNTGTGSTGGFGGLSALTSGRLGNLGGVGGFNSILSNLGFNLRRDEAKFTMRDLDDELMYLSKRDPQFGNFNLASILNSFGNGTATGTGAGGFGGLSAFTNGRLGNFGGASNLNNILSDFGFNLRRDEDKPGARSPMPLAFSFKEDSAPVAEVTKRVAFGLDAFVQAKRNN